MEHHTNSSKQRAEWRKEIGPGERPDETLCIKLTLSYQPGGLNMWHGTKEARGYSVSIGPVTIIKRDGYNMETMMGGAGLRRFLFEVGRKSDKQFLKAVEMVAPVAEHILDAAKGGSEQPFSDRELYSRALALIAVPVATK